MSKLDNTAISKVLGQRVDVPKVYDKNILVREPRSSNREYLGIQETSLPFVGVDVWNNWEISALTDTGLPVVGIGKITYPCDSKYIVESKSAKLYFNSFNMTKMGKTPLEVVSSVERIASKDLSEFLETKVVVKIFDTTKNLDCKLQGYDTLDREFPELDTNFYNETPLLLKISTQQEIKTERFHSSLLRSNCRVTGQPDAGDVYIHHKSKNTINRESLLKYIISFRNECHFHEEICECIYVRLKELLLPEELMVACFYVRRGSLDINPIRSTHEHLMPLFIKTPELPFFKSPRQ